MSINWDPAVNGPNAVADGSITDPKIVSVASSKLTGPIPSTWLGSSSSVAAAGLHGPAHGVGGLDPLYSDGGHYNPNTVETLALGREYGVHDAPTLAGGTLYLTYFTAARDVTLNQLILACSNVFAGMTYLEASFYTAGADGAVSMVRRTGDLSATSLPVLTAAPNTVTNITGLTATGLVSVPLTKDQGSAGAANYPITRGARYAMGLCGAGATVGRFLGILGGTGSGPVWYNTATFGGLAGLFSPVMAKQVAGSYSAASPIPTAHAAAAGQGSPVRLYGILAG